MFSALEVSLYDKEASKSRTNLTTGTYGEIRTHTVHVLSVLSPTVGLHRHISDSGHLLVEAIKMGSYTNTAKRLNTIKNILKESIVLFKSISQLLPYNSNLSLTYSALTYF